MRLWRVKGAEYLFAEPSYQRTSLLSRAADLVWAGRRRLKCSESETLPGSGLSFSYWSLYCIVQTHFADLKDPMRTDKDVYDVDSIKKKKNEAYFPCHVLGEDLFGVRWMSCARILCSSISSLQFLSRCFQALLSLHFITASGLLHRDQ